MIYMFTRRCFNKNRINLWLAEYREPFSPASVEVRYAKPVEWGEYSKEDVFPEAPTAALSPDRFNLGLNELREAGIDRENPERATIHALQGHIELLKEQIKEMTGVIRTLASK